MGLFALMEEGELQKRYYSISDLLSHRNPELHARLEEEHQTVHNEYLSKLRALVERYEPREAVHG